MKIESKTSFVIIGFALFAMFFGSGNLIFPLDVGREAADGWAVAALGFLTTAVLVPFLGIVAMVVYRGHTQQFFSILGTKLALVITAVVLTVWIPLGSGPRCIVLAASSLATHTQIPPMWLFSLIWSLAASIVVYKRGRMLDILGFILTPLLLVCLGLTIILGFQSESHLQASCTQAGSLFFLGAKEGYNTMDLIASFFFSASIIEILRQSAKGKSHHPLTITLKAGIIGISLLAAVYLGLMSLAAHNCELLGDTPKDQLLATVAKKVLGPELGLIAIGAIFLACFTTFVALVVVFAEFLATFIKSQKICRILTLLLCYAMSLTGLEGITAITQPVLQAFYPLLILLIFINLFRHFYYFRGI